MAIVTQPRRANPGRVWSSITRRGSWIRVITEHPALGPAVGAIVVYVLFVIVAGQVFYGTSGMGTWLTQSAELGIPAVPVALLMIAGEFDLSIGSMIGASGMTVAITVGNYHWAIWTGVLLALTLAIGVGALNGCLVVRTGLPSFIVTLAALFILRGLTIGVTQVLTGSTNISLNGAQQGSGLTNILVSVHGWFSVEVLWWLGLTVVGTVILTRTWFGNWIYGTGGDIQSARSVGVRVHTVRISLFVATACGAALVGVMQVLLAGSADVLQGQQKELQTIVAVVIGGCLLTGGYGTIVGAALGSLTIGMAQLGITYAGWDPDWYQAFLGVILLAAVLANNVIRRSAVGGR